VHVDAVDAKGNLASFTPSGAWISSADVIGPLGFPLSVRMMTFYLEPAHHPNLVAPFKRPRTTLTPSLAFRNGKPWMAFGTMGGDNQGQWLLQYYLCVAAFGMSIPEAIEAPRLSSEHTPGFFAPHASEPNRVRIEPRFGSKVLDELRRRGHDLDVAPDWSEGFVSAAAFDEDTGVMEAGCDPRGSKSNASPVSPIVLTRTRIEDYVHPSASIPHYRPRHPGKSPPRRRAPPCGAARARGGDRQSLHRHRARAR
jgi:gamma-glutamyltranspeptidase/glutathione hydrolase